jgi:hypothetical protein
MISWQGSLGTIENIHEWLDRCARVYGSNKAGAQIKIDISNLGNLSPIGCTTLISTLDFLNDKFYIDLKIPRDDKIIGYLERMNFFRTCHEEIKELFDNQTDMNRYYRRNRNNKANSLFEITKCTDSDAVAELYNSIIRILRDKSLPRDRVSDIANIVSELGANSLEHAECAPYTCIQYYSGSSRTVSIAICDTGPGIYNSLKHEFSPLLSSHAVIRKAVLTNASRHGKGVRGTGLMDVNKRAYNFRNVSFYLRTHSSAYSIKEDKLEILSRGEFFSGTFFYLTIRV